MIKKSKLTLVNYINKRIRSNKNFLCCFVGPTGSGKSYACLRLTEHLDPNFNINRIAFSVEEFFSIITNQKLPPGSVIIFEEAGVNISSQEWWSKSNRAFNYFGQTSRHRNHILLFNSPDFSYISSSTRKLFHMICEMKKIDYVKKRSIIKPFYIQTNLRTGKAYYKFLRKDTKSGYVPIGATGLSLPNDNLIKLYEEKKTKFTTELYKDLFQEMNLDKQNKDWRKKMTQKQQEVYDMLEEGLKPKEIAEKLGGNLAGIYKHINLIKKKGYLVANGIKNQE